MSFLVGICGGSGSGKTTLADGIVGSIRRNQGSAAAAVLSFDSYYHDQPHLPVEDRAKVNYDHPDALDAELLVRHLQQLRQGQDIAVPVYDFTSHQRSDDIRIVPAAEVVVVEGILLFTFHSIWEQLDFRVFRHCPEEIRFSRRTRRDIVERGRSPASVEAQLAATVKPMHDRFVEPYADKADFVTEHGQDLHDATDRIVARLSQLTTSSR